MVNLKSFVKELQQSETSIKLYIVKSDIKNVEEKLMEKTLKTVQAHCGFNRSSSRLLNTSSTEM